MSATDKLGLLKVQPLSNLKSARALILAAILFQTVWFLCILTHPLVWSLAVLVYFIVYLYLYRGRVYLSYITVVASLGIALDFAQFRLGFINFDDARFPLWLVALWVVFAASIPFAFRFLRKKYLLAVVLGGPGGASSYYAAARLRGDIAFDYGAVWDIIPLGLIWAIFMPTVIFILDRINPENAKT